MDDLLKNKLTCNYDEINQLKLPFNKQVILEVLKDDVKYEFLLNLKIDSKKLLVFSSGARNIKDQLYT